MTQKGWRRIKLTGLGCPEFSLADELVSHFRGIGATVSAVAPTSTRFSANNVKIAWRDFDGVLSAISYGYECLGNVLLRAGDVLTLAGVDLNAYPWAIGRSKDGAWWLAYAGLDGGPLETDGREHVTVFEKPARDMRAGQWPQDLFVKPSARRSDADVLEWAIDVYPEAHLLQSIFTKVGLLDENDSSLTARPDLVLCVLGWGNFCARQERWRLRFQAADVARSVAVKTSRVIEGAAHQRDFVILVYRLRAVAPTCTDVVLADRILALKKDGALTAAELRSLQLGNMPLAEQRERLRSRIAQLRRA